MFTFQFDLVSSWTKGTFKIKKDTLYLKTILIFDTIRNMNSKTNSLTDSLILSEDERSNLGFDSVDTYSDGKRERVLLPYNQRQNTFAAPEKLFYRRHKLYEIGKDGKLVKGKQAGIWPIRSKLLGEKKFPRWYSKKQVEQ